MKPKNKSKQPRQQNNVAVDCLYVPDAAVLMVTLSFHYGSGSKCGALTGH